jgi:ribosomal 30S subunit maturation factor RimM
MLETFENDRYQQYIKNGGIINKKDYEGVLDRAQTSSITLESSQVKQVELMAKFAGIELNNAENTIDQRIILYEILRSDSKPEDAEYHHSQMSDQRLFAEALRMLGDIDSLKKLIQAYPNISFV